MRPRTLIALLGVGRAATGAVALAVGPGPLGALFGDVARQPFPRMLVRMAGVRDLVLGLATLDARRQPRRLARLASLAAVCDLTDAVVAASTPGLTRRTRAITVPAGSVAAIAGVVGAWRLRGSARS